MTENKKYYTPVNYTDHTKFGGLINASDFNTDFRGKDEKTSSIAQKIISDMKFDKRCKNNTVFRDRKREHSDRKKG